MRAWTALVTLGVAAAGCGSGYMGGGGNGYAAPPPASCTAATATPLTNGTVTMPGMLFSPACAKVPAGTLVTFVNDDATAHTVTWDAGQAVTADSGPLAPNATFQHTFTTAGTEQIHCTIHPTMHLTVIVQ